MSTAAMVDDDKLLSCSVFEADCCFALSIAWNLFWQEMLLVGLV